MYQPSHFTTEIGRMRAEEMRARADRYRTIQKAKRHKAESEPEPEKSLSRSRIFVYRKALGIVGLSVLVVLVFAAAAMAMPVDAPYGVDGNDQTVTEGQVGGPIGGQEPAGQVDQQPATDVGNPGVTSNSGGRELEIVLLLSGTIGLASLGAFFWFRQHSIKSV